MDIDMSPRNKGVAMDDGDGIAGTDIFINRLLDLDTVNMDPGDINTVRSIVAMTIIYFSGGQGNPRYMRRSINPAHIPRPPVNRTSRGRNPAPADRSHIGPSSIMIRHPTPRLIRDPNIVAAYP